MNIIITVLRNLRILSRRRTRIMYQHFLLRYIVCVEVFDLEVIDGDRVVQCSVFRLFDDACRSVVKIFSCIRAFLFPDSLSKSIILVLLGIINQSAYLHVSCKVSSRGFLTVKVFDNSKLLLLVEKMTAEEIPPSFPCSHILLFLFPKITFLMLFQTALNTYV